jgi:hypothetical protein
MPLYLTDPPYPDRLRCESCGETVAALPDNGEPPPRALTAGQAAHLWPQLAEDVAGHEAARPAGPLKPAPPPGR